MALHLRSNKDVKKSSYYVWYLGAREAKGVDSMPSAIAHLLERERLQEPFKVTLQVSSKGLKIIQTVHPGGSSRSAVKHLVPSNAVLAVIQREDVVAASLRLPNSTTSNIVHVHAYRCDSVETAELLGGQLKIFAVAHAENIARISSVEGRIRGNLGSDGRSTRESESSEGSGELRHDPVQTTIYESLAAELRAKLGRGNSGDDVGPILLPPRDYDTVHRQRGNLAGIEFRRCLNQTIVGGSSAVDRGGTRSAASSGIGSDSAATPPPYQPHHSLGSRPSRPSRDSSSDDDWAAATEDNFLPETETGTNLTLPRVPRSPERLPSQVPIRGISPSTRNRRAAELRQRSPSPQYQPRNSPSDVTTPRERFQDAKEKFRAMEKREAIVKPFIPRQREVENNRVVHRVQSNKLEPSRPMYDDRSNRQHPINVNSTASHENLIIRRTHQELLERENDMLYRGKPRPRTHHYAIERPSEPELSRARPRSFYENPSIVRDFRDQKNNLVDPREIRDYRDRGHPRDIREKIRPRVTTYHEMTEHERYSGLDRDSARSPLEIVPSAGRYRHSYAEPPRLGLAALHPY